VALYHRGSLLHWADALSVPQDRHHFLFKEFDDDGSGDLTAEEFSAKLKKVQPDMSDTDVMMFVRECDKDNDGTVSMMEFSALVRFQVRRKR
jgi:Ca2+-binding EF-hand superfamily protein